MFLLQSFEHFDVISMVDKSIDHVILKNNNIDSLDVLFWKFLRKSRARERKPNCAIMTSFLWSVLLSNTKLSTSQRARNSVKNILTLCLKYASLSLSSTRQQIHQTRLSLRQEKKS